MKKLLLLIIAVLSTLPSLADDVYISVAMPKDDGLDDNTHSLLKDKLLNIVSLDGVASMECCAIALVPEVNVLNKELVEGGMRNITTMELSVTIQVRNVLNDAVFNTTSVSLRGEGFSETEAIRSAIRKIVPEEYTGFVSETKRRIMLYYHNNTTSLITKANTLVNRRQYDEALAVLSSYPESLPGYTQVSDAINSILRKAQTEYCSEILQAAKAAYATRNFEEAANIASVIDITGSCGPEAEALLDSIRQQVELQHTNNMKTEQQRAKSEERITMATIHAARDIAVAYYKRCNNYIFFW